METVWIPIFILTFAECVAPAGKSVCQEQQFELRFLNRSDCDYALQQLVAVKDEDDRVIVNRQKTVCAPSALEAESYDSLKAISEANKDQANWRAPGNVDARRSAVNEGHSDRLTELKTCEETSGAAPCKIGDIIVEAASGDSVEVWKRD